MDDVGYGEGYGVELSATAKLTENGTLRGWYAAQRVDDDAPPPAIPGAARNSGRLPRNQASLTNSFDLKCGRQFDIITRHVDNLPAVNLPAYMAFDARFAWNVGRNFSASIVGRNLFDPRHNPASSSHLFQVCAALAAFTQIRFKAVFIGMIVLLLSCVPAGFAGAQHGVTSEQKLKVAYLYNFIRYVQWPKKVFASDDSPFVIGILAPPGIRHLADLASRLRRRKYLGQRRLRDSCQPRW